MLEANAEKYILFEDKDIIVCRKPAGIAVQNARIGAMDLESGLKNYLASAGNGRQIPYLAVVHRLDQPAVITRLRERVRSTLFSTTLRTPTAEIIP